MEKYDALIAAIGKSMKTLGFLKKGNTFYLFKNDNWGLLNFQKSMSSTSTSVSFTINLGISSTALRRTVDEEDITKKPSMLRCHWQERIGALLPQKQDYWWKLDSNTSVDQLTNEITWALISVAIPEIEKHISDESLIKEWLDYVAVEKGHYSHYMRYIHLTTLLKIHKKESLQQVLDDFIKAFSKGGSIDYAVKEHIKALEKFV